MSKMDIVLQALEEYEDERLYFETLEEFEQYVENSGKDKT